MIAGSALGWTSPAQPKLEEGKENEGWITLSSEEISWIGSLTPAGAVIGPILVGLLADRIGRKWTLLSAACPALVSWLMLIFVRSVVPIYIGRFILGIAIGMVYAVTPMYVGEISEVSPEPFAGVGYSVTVPVHLFSITQQAFQGLCFNCELMTNKLLLPNNGPAPQNHLLPIGTILDKVPKPYQCSLENECVPRCLLVNEKGFRNIEPWTNKISVTLSTTINWGKQSSLVEGNVNNSVLEGSKNRMCCLGNIFNKSVGTVTIFGPYQFTQCLLSLIVYNRSAEVLLQAGGFHICGHTERPHRH